MSEADPLAFEEGRYLFCAVRLDGDVDDDEGLPDRGIEDGRVTVLGAGDVGAVVQPVDSVFDSDDAARVREWLLDHERVVERVADAYGTPLPFRFDTILTGDDDAVYEWLEENRGAIESALESLAGRWEYRIRIRWRPDLIRSQVLEDRAPLRELAEEVEAAGDGTAYLKRKQYEQRLADHLQSRRESIAESLRTDLARHAVDVQRSSGTDRTGLAGDEGDEDLETVVGFAVLAERDDEGPIGDVLEPIADRPPFEVQYTGPWPPYSFAPSIDSEGEGEGPEG